ncbi:MAG: hypothetical protein R3E44_07160 [Paracoccaceae bacterium]
MNVSDDLIDRLSSETGRRLADSARAGRRRVLPKITQCCVTVTSDGRAVQDEYFESAPTLGELVDRVGPEAYVVSVAIRRKPLTRRFQHLLAVAE